MTDRFQVGLASQTNYWGEHSAIIAQDEHAGRHQGRLP